MRKYRMYGLVPYQLTGAQAGIQFLHAVIEYANDNFTDQDYQQWSKVDKTVIMLNGGTTNGNPDRLGTLNKHVETLRSAGVTVATFHEPDLADTLTAVAFLVDDMVWDKETYPEFIPKHDYTKPVDPETKRRPLTEDSAKEFETWKGMFGADADRVIFFREFLRIFRLAGS